MSNNIGISTGSHKVWGGHWAPLLGCLTPGTCLSLASYHGQFGRSKSNIWATAEGTRKFWGRLACSLRTAACLLEL